jgi:hypothetical protein
MNNRNPETRSGRIQLHIVWPTVVEGYPAVTTILIDRDFGRTVVDADADVDADVLTDPF